jgi:hypothetical protein
LDRWAKAPAGIVEEHHAVARDQQLGRSLGMPFGGIGDFEPGVVEMRAALAGGLDQVRRDVDAGDLDVRAAAGDRQRQFAGAAADVGHRAERELARALEQVLGQRRKAAVGTAPFGRPARAYPAAPFVRIGHSCSLSEANLKHGFALGLNNEEAGAGPVGRRAGSGS